MTASPESLTEASVDPVPAPEEPSSAAFSLLCRAQALADGLRAEVEAEAAVMRAQFSTEVRNAEPA